MRTVGALGATAVMLGLTACGRPAGTPPDAGSATQRSEAAAARAEAVAARVEDAAKRLERLVERLEARGSPAGGAAAAR